ncbi:MAG: hypothetical protein AMJ81_02910 [Phycisphaerae bacterium SM23_33]|nr:MAG: hypothetical protein AMJ81_02910 [Phycisphaerae bacterium SM23_33]
MKEVQQAAPQSRPPLSKLAAAGAICGALFFTLVGPLGLILGLAALWRTRAGRRRGRELAKLALALGILSLAMYFVPLGAVLLPPPGLPADRQLRRFLDDLAAGKYHQPDAWRPLTGPAASSRAEWARMVNQRYGRGRVVWGQLRFNSPEGLNIFWVQFEKAGIREVTTAWAGPPGTAPLFYEFGDLPTPSQRLKIFEQDEQDRESRQAH